MDPKSKPVCPEKLCILSVEGAADTVDTTPEAEKQTDIGPRELDVSDRGACKPSGLGNIVEKTADEIKELMDQLNGNSNVVEYGAHPGGVL